MQPMWCKKNIIENVPKGDPVIVKSFATHCDRQQIETRDVPDLDEMGARGDGRCISSRWCLCIHATFFL